MFDRTARRHRRLAALSREVTAHRERLAVLEEQVAFLRGVESDAAVDAVVVGPEAVRDHSMAERDLARAQRERDEVAKALRDARAEQDRLLESLTEDGPR